MVRTQVQFTEEQIAVLRARAAREGISISELVRRSVDSFIAAEPDPTPDELRRRALAVAGRFASGGVDTARQHDRYLSEAYRS